MKSILAVMLATLSLSTLAQRQLPPDGIVDIWPTIPFIRGADLCKYKDAYGQTRSEYMGQMVSHAQRLMQAGAKGQEALSLLMNFNALYDRNQEIAVRYQYLDVTLESTFKAFVDGYYRNLQPREKRISFTNVTSILNIVDAARNGQREGYLDSKLLSKLDFVAYGTYALAPNCKGDIQVTLHMVGKNGRTESFEAHGNPSTVMSQIASEIFTLYQRTQNGTVRMGNRQLEIVGSLNGTVGTVSSPELAEEACSMLDARLPKRMEMELLDSMGDWSGGISLGRVAWAMANGKVYHPLLMNPTPVRNRHEVNDTIFYYYCVR